MRIDPADLGPWQITVPVSCDMKAETITDTRTIECAALQIPDGYSIANTGSVTFLANHYIDFGTDFRVENGGIMRAMVGSDAF